ncbi:MAG: hypothetical protein ACR2HH_15850 [Chthoniobacterales bacterium]
MTPDGPLTSSVLLANPHVVDLYLQNLEFKAKKAEANLLFCCAHYENRNQPEAVRRADEQLTVSLGGATESFAALSAAYRDLPNLLLHHYDSRSPELIDILDKRSELEAACAAMEDAAIAACRAAEKQDLPLMYDWRDQMVARAARFNALRSEFYRQRVLLAG